MSRVSRRRYLQSGTVLVAILAGCAETQPASQTDETATNEDESPSATTTETAQTATSTATTNTTATPGDLDLREANVVGVETEARNGSYRFDVTLIHDDSGEDGYANWWQVETLDGEQLGRRDLLHAHGTQEFTRSETVKVPDGTTCVVVRGHDQNHGYGGEAMLVNLESGATEAVRQGGEKQSVADATCP
jgi:anti-sigma28 factor (negative regulator of flagellin synthesis)